MYLIGIDETGTSSSFNSIVKKISNGVEVNGENYKYIISFVKMDKFAYSELQKELKNLKANFGISGLPLHAIDFVNKQNDTPYKKWGAQKWVSFCKEIENIIDKIDFTYYLSFVDAVSHINKYKNPVEPYSLSVQYLMERVFYDVPQSSEINFHIEARGPYEDVPVLKTMKSITKEFDRRDKVNISFDKKRKSDDGGYSEVIEVADIICYLSRIKYIRVSKKVEKLQRNGVFTEEWINQILNDKIQDRRTGYGIVNIG